MATKPSDPPVDPPPPAKATTLPAKPSPIGGKDKDDDGYAGTGKTAADLVKEFGTKPDGSPATEAPPETPNCPPVSLSDGPFDTTAIPPGCSEPLSAECAAYYNSQIDANKATQKG